MIIPILGAKRAGKTFLISLLVHYFRTKKNSTTSGFIPFEADLSRKNGEDRLTDAEVFALLNEEGNRFPAGLFTAYGPHPFEYSFNAEGNKAKREVLENVLERYGEHFQVVWAELSGGFLNPLGKGFSNKDLVLSLGQSPLYLLSPVEADFTSALAELALLQSMEVRANVIINNSNDTSDIHWLEFIWKQASEYAEILHVMPFLPDPNDWEKEEVFRVLEKIDNSIQFV